MLHKIPHKVFSILTYIKALQNLYQNLEVLLMGKSTMLKAITKTFKNQGLGKQFYRGVTVCDIAGL
jgi:hypothetical protein